MPFKPIFPRSHEKNSSSSGKSKEIIDNLRNIEKQNKTNLKVLSKLQDVEGLQ